MVKSVVIIGLGYGGFSAARALDGNRDVYVTVVEAREGFLLHKWGSLRAATAGKVWVERALIPTAAVLKRGKVVHGLVESVDEDAQVVRCSTGETIPYDVLVIATGARNFSVGEPPLSVSTLADTKAYFAQAREVISQAKAIVVVGAGPVACELVGELKSYTRAKLTLNCGDEALLKNVKPPLSRSTQASIRKMLSGAQVEVIQGDRVVFPVVPSLDEGRFNRNAFVKVEGGQVELASGKKVPCDLVLFATGGMVSTSFLPPTWCDPVSREVKVDKFLRVQGSKQDNVFCLGDAAGTGRTKLGYLAMQDGEVVAKNVALLVQGKKPTVPMPGSTSFIVLSFGTSGGKTLTGFVNLGGTLTSMFKSKGLFAGMLWGAVAGESVPKGEQ